MKKNIKLFIGILIGLIVATSIGVTASVLYNSSEIGFTPTDSSWKVDNLEDAINDLYETKSSSTSALNVSIKGNINANNTLDTNSWTLVNSKGLSLDTTVAGTHYVNIPFTPAETGDYMLVMNLSKDEQDNGKKDSNESYLHYGIASNPLTTFGTYDIVNDESLSSVHLTAGTTYYIGAIDILTFKTRGYSRVEFSSVIVSKVN